MTQAEQVKARIIQTVTGQAVVPSIQAEAGDPGPDNAQSAPTPGDEIVEALKAMIAGIPLPTYRAIKALEARVAELEARNG